MSLTSKQIDELRAYAKDRKGELAKLINDAADTIEVLSVKVIEPTIEPDKDAIWDALSKVYNMKDVPDEAKNIIGDLMLSLDGGGD